MIQKKKTLYKGIAYGMLILAFALFGTQIYYNFGQVFQIDMSVFMFIGAVASIIFSLIVIAILKLVSKLQIYSIYDNKSANTIKIIIYTLIVFMFMFWCSLITINLIFLGNGIMIGPLVYKFFLRSMLTALIYAVSVNVFFFSLAIPLPKKENKNELRDSK